MRRFYQSGVDVADRTEARVARQGGRDCDFAPLSGQQIAQLVWPDGDPHQAQRRIPDRGSHATHLAIAALGDDDFNPTRRDRSAVAYRRIARPQRRLRYAPHDGRARARAGEQQPATKALQRILVGFAFDLRPVDLRKFMTRISEPVLQVPVVGEQ